MNTTDGTGFYTCKKCHQTEFLWNHITTDHKEEEQLEDRRNVGENGCNSGDGTDQRVQSLMFMMMHGSMNIKWRISTAKYVDTYNSYRASNGYTDHTEMFASRFSATGTCCIFIFQV